MLVSYELKLDIKKDENNKIYNYGSILQGALLETIESSYVEKLHNERYNPYSQYVYFNEQNECIWKISTISEEAYINILQNGILKKNNFKLKQKDLDVNILEKKLVSKTTMKELFKKWFMNDNVENKVKFKIITPVSYKEDNKYQIVPNVAFILNNLINKWNAFSTNTIEPEILQEYINKTYISNYNLKSTIYYLEKVKIKSYMGRLELTINANEMMKNMLQMLFEFGTYSGLGIKTSMGMGGISNP